MKERLKAALKAMQEIAEELQSNVNEFSAKKSDWYYHNLMLNYSGLMDDEEFEKKIWKVNHEQLSTDMGSEINTLQWAMKDILGKYEYFKKVCDTLDGILANEANRVPEGWKAYKVMYNEKGDDVEQEFYCYAPNEETAKQFCRKNRGNDVLSINKVEEEKK